ncbi:hypothetical protein [Pseudorhodobacter ferrugineus]|uniref:hypothetical protein n=1 Tax=Pseudorhodobacter ferrugineus TaxID=77008 RepID=UPI0012DE139F|nr:hypothetical protein [Pseudorhodobacter ferrugineus]
MEQTKSDHSPRSLGQRKQQASLSACLTHPQKRQALQEAFGRSGGTSVAPDGRCRAGLEMSKGRQCKPFKKMKIKKNILDQWATATCDVISN